MSSFAIAAILAYILREAVTHTLLFAWCSLMALSLLFRAVLIFAYQRTPAVDPAAAQTRLLWFRLVILVAGGVWGSAGILLFPAHDLQYQMFLIFILTGVTAGGVVSFSADLGSAMIFSVLVIAPLIIRLLAMADSLSVSMGMGGVVYLAFMAMSLRRINQNILENIGLRLEAAGRVEKLFQQNQVSDDIINSLPGIFYLLNQQGKLVRVNQKLLDVSGYSRTEIDNMASLDFFEGDDKNLIAKKMREAFEQGDASAEVEMVTKAGQKIPYYFSGHRVSIDGLIYLVGLGIDLTERRLADDALHLSTARIETLMNSVVEGIYGVDMQGNCTFINSTGLQMLGYQDDTELVGKHMHDLIHHTRADGSPYPAAECRLYACLRSHTDVHVDDEFFWRKDGSSFPVDYWSRPTTIHGEQGAVVTFIDITERKKAEAELRIAATAFESQEGMLITDANSTILRVNHAFTDITGYSAEEIIGNNPRILNSGRQDKHFYSAMWDSINHKGAWEGEIWNRRKNGEIYPEHLSITAVKDRNGVVTNYVANLNDVTARKETEEKIKHLAFYDPLTQLPNRRLLQDRLHQALASSGRSGRQGAILFIDLDNFKAINDTLGHNIGDLLLQQVAQRLETCVREGDTVARLGGDEFVVMLEDLSIQALEAAEQTQNTGEKILATLNQPYLLASHEYRSTPSIGATLFDSHHPEIDDLLKKADIAMYQAKKAGRNTLRFFDPQMQDSINARAALEDELRTAIEKHQFRLHYQVQVDSMSRPTGAEALIRWMHPERGLLSPAEFMPLVEEAELILQVGQWVLDEGCAQLERWQANPLLHHLTLAVNVSGKQFRHPDFAEQVRVALQRHNIGPMRLKVELTESVLLENIEDAISKMRTLQELGVSISLDDFGTGFSSLSYLKRLPLNQIKIDQSFVRNITTDPGDVVMVRTIVDLGLNFELDVIAEGVETEAQFILLHRYGCAGFQGYLFSKPLPLEQFEAPLGRHWTGRA